MKERYEERGVVELLCLCLWCCEDDNGNGIWAK